MVNTPRTGEFRVPIKLIALLPTPFLGVTKQLMKFIRKSRGLPYEHTRIKKERSETREEARIRKPFLLNPESRITSLCKWPSFKL